MNMKFTYVVAVRVPNTLQYVRVKLFYKNTLVLRRDKFNSLANELIRTRKTRKARERTDLLHDSASVHVLSELQNVSLHRGSKLTSLIGSAVLEQLLNNLRHSR